MVKEGERSYGTLINKSERFLKMPDTMPHSNSIASLIFKSVALIKHQLQMNIFEVFKVEISATLERKLLSIGLC